MVRQLTPWHETQQIIECHERLALGFASLNPTYVAVPLKMAVKGLREVFMGTGYKPSRVCYLLNQ